MLVTLLTIMLDQSFLYDIGILRCHLCMGDWFGLLAGRAEIRIADGEVLSWHRQFLLLPHPLYRLKGLECVTRG